MGFFRTLPDYNIPFMQNKPKLVFGHEHGLPYYLEEEEDEEEKDSETLAKGHCTFLE